MNGNTLNIFLLSLGLLQGLLIIVLILSRDRVSRSPNLYLALFILALSYQTISKILSKSWYAHHFRFLYTLAYDLPFVYGPIVYLYVAKSLRREPWKPVDLLHFLPFITGLLAIVFYAFTTLPVLSRITYVFHDRHFHIPAQLGSLLVYTVLIVKLFGKTDVDQSDVKKTAWIRRFALVSMAVCTFLTSCMILMFEYFPRYEPLRYLFLILPLLMYWISYQSLAYPHFFRQSPDEIAAAPPGAERVKYRKTPLQEVDADLTLQSLLDYFDREEPYLDPECSLDKVAASLQLSRNHLSQVINQKLSVNFFELLRERRLEKARVLLQDPARQHLTIAAIAFEAGFNSISSFNEVFKKRYQLTPKDHRGQFFNPESA